MSDRVQEAHEIRRDLLGLADRVVALIEGEGPTGVLPHASSPGQRLVEARSRLGLSQTELAEKSGVSANAIVNFEKGHTKPRIKTLMALAEAVEQPWELFRGEGGEG